MKSYLPLLLISIESERYINRGAYKYQWEKYGQIGLFADVSWSDNHDAFLYFVTVAMLDDQDVDELKHHLSQIRY